MIHLGLSRVQRAPRQRNVPLRGAVRHNRAPMEQVRSLDRDDRPGAPTEVLPELPGKEPAKVSVARSPTRCPYCHDDCAPEGAVVCEGCLSRHHAGCWREGGDHCASCQGTRALRGSEPPKLAVAPAELELVRKGSTPEAVQRLARRAKVTEAAATTALLEAAAAELERTQGKKKSPGALAILSLFGALVLLIPIVAICASEGGVWGTIAVVAVYCALLERSLVRLFK
jgi:hypothetical protein